MASGGSVVGLKYNGGVLLASDTLLSYGSLAKWPNIPRIKLIGSHTAICATGDYADFQDMTELLSSHVNQLKVYGNGALQPKEVFCYLQRNVYHKRSNFEPCLCQFVVAGCHGGEPFLGGVDDVGTQWVDDCVATGYGAHIALPLLRQALEKPGGLSRGEALEVLRNCLRVLFYRECRTINKFQIADATNNVVVLGEPFEVETNWEYEGFCFEKTAIIR
ncbi:putative Proteasome subunit [Trypanosoma vivax]|uniref:Proteasome subunit beta n=1 Tax=Trypanosoma vivax (strain Y486) TaxID=1055687 RepID=G0TTR8_TRYVY|nr:proteasome beta 7 subunit [Trypanosoma vivax]KAH8613997.1 putative Proteasome subunit [Trypanosoma vivax]CCC47349.1 proteasome beta 7 subunit [Trypanosoma vivax Y486]